MIGNICLKRFHAVVTRAIVTSTQPPDFPKRHQGIEKLLQLRMCLHRHVPESNSNCQLGHFHLYAFLLLSMLSFFSVPLTSEHSELLSI